MEGILDEEIILWKKDLESGLTISKISKKYNRDWTSVAKAIRRIGEREFRRLTTPEKIFIQAEYKKGLTIQQIAKNTKFSDGTIWRCVKKVVHNIKKKRINIIKKNINLLTEFEIGYIVGIIEGEGYIGITIDGDRLRPKLSISNCDKRMVDYFNYKLGFGNVLTNKRKKNNWTQIFSWSVQHKKNLLLLFEKIYPYMISKKEEIGLILSIIECKDANQKLLLFHEFQQIKRKKNSKVKLTI